MTRTIRNKSMIWLFISMLIIQLLVPAGTATAVGTADGLVMTFAASKPEVQAGEVFDYLINYSASSTVSNFADPNITFTLPAGVAYVGKSDSTITASTVEDSELDPSRKKVTFAFKGGVLPAGSTGQLVVKAQFANYTTPDGTSATGSPVFHATVDGEPVTLNTNDVTVTSRAAAEWGIEKKKIRPVPEPFKGSDVEYQILLSEKAGVTFGRLDSNDFVVTDTLPPGAVFVSADNGGVHVPADNTVVWNLGDNLRGNKVLSVIVHYPNSIPETEVTNVAEASFTPIGGTRTTVSDDITHGFETMPKDGGSIITKWVNPAQKEISPGQLVKFFIDDFDNNSNLPLTSAVITDMTPQLTDSGKPVNLELKSVVTASYTGITDYDVWYTTVTNPSDTDWQFWKTVTASARSTLDATAISGDIKGVQFRFDTLPINFTQKGTYELTYKVPDDFIAPADSYERVKNFVKLDYTFNGTPKTLEKYAYVDIVGDRPLIRLVKDSTKLAVKPQETTTFKITATNMAAYSSDQLENPVLTDDLPAEFEYVPGTWTITKPAGMTTDPDFKLEPQPDGTTKMTWFWSDANPAALQIGEAMTISFDAKVKAGTPNGVVKNKVTITSPNYLNDTNFSNVKCLSCLPDGSQYDILTDINVTLLEEVALQAQMYVKGELDSDWSKYPDSGTTAPGGRSLYRLDIQNVGNVATKDLVIINTFPRIGDRAVVGGTAARDSKWGPLLTGAVQVPDYVSVFYSTSPAVTMNATTGADTGVWTTEPPADLTSVTAVKFDFDDDYVIDPLDSTTMEWPMVAPVGAPTGGEIAWNSFAYKMNKADGTAILPSEPLKVGIKLAASPKAEIGDIVWLDANENGIQDATETGVNGVRVELRDALDNKLAETLTGDDFAGNPGAYLFPNLDPGDYTVVFLPSPATGVLTRANQGADDSKDSDAVPATGRTSLITLADGEKNVSVDAGLVPKKGSIGNTVWIDANGNGLQDEAAAGIGGVTVELLNSTGTLLTSVKTAADGSYLFADLLPGDYQVRAVLPSIAYAFTGQKQGGDAAIDSDVNTGSGRSDMITLAQGEDNLTVDVGLVKLAVGSIGDFVWMDTNRNGLQDPGEKGLNSIRVQLLNDQNALVAETTTADRLGQPGYYVFDNLDAGQYSLRFIAPHPFTKRQAGSQPDLDSNVDTKGETGVITLNPGEHLDTLDAGVYLLGGGGGEPEVPGPGGPSPEQPKGKGSLGDFIWYDSNRNGLQDDGIAGLNGVLVELYDATGKLIGSATTRFNFGNPGYYLFSDLLPGEYRVKVTAPAGYTFTVDTDPSGFTKTVQIKEGDNDLTLDIGLIKITDTQQPGTPGQPGQPGQPGGTPGQPSPGGANPQQPQHPQPGSNDKPAAIGTQLPLTGEKESILPWIGLLLCLFAGSLLTYRRFAK